MPRVTATEVKQIISTKLAGSALDPFIAVANQLVTTLLASKQSLTDDIRKEIERWLSAHYVAIYETMEAGRGVISFSGIGGAGNKGASGAVGIKNTTYGRTAIELDISGALAMLGSKAATMSIINVPDLS